MLLKAGSSGVKEVDPSIQVMLHIDRGNNLSTSRSFIQNAMTQGVVFDVFGESCYTAYQGQPSDWMSTFTQLQTAFPTLKFVIAEYGPEQRAANDIMFNLPNQAGIGTYNWEPTHNGAWNTGHVLFSASGNRYTATADLSLYDAMKTAYASRLEVVESDRPGPGGRAPGDGDAAQRAAVEPDRSLELVGNGEARRPPLLKLARRLLGELPHHAQHLRGRQREARDDLDLTGGRDRGRRERRGLTRRDRQPVRHHQAGRRIREVRQRTHVARRRLAGGGAIMAGAGARPSRAQLQTRRAGLGVGGAGIDGDGREHAGHRQRHLVRVHDFQARVERERHRLGRRTRAEQPLAEQRGAPQRHRHQIGTVVGGDMVRR
jgi:hypothetical protein